MHSESRGAFLLVRSLADMQRINEELAAYLTILRRWSPGCASGAIRGIWVDDEGVANLPSTLVLPDACGVRRTVRIPETTGINGIWMLCWLEAQAATISRIDLVAALLERFDHEETDAAKLAVRFIPIFSGNAYGHSAKDESYALEARYPGLVLAPGYQDENGGLFFLQALSTNNGRFA